MPRGIFCYLLSARALMIITPSPYPGASFSAKLSSSATADLYLLIRVIVMAIIGAAIVCLRLQIFRAFL
jgi:hypothetical protein